MKSRQYIYLPKYLYNSQSRLCIDFTSCATRQLNSNSLYKHLTFLSTVFLYNSELNKKDKSLYRISKQGFCGVVRRNVIHQRIIWFDLTSRIYTNYNLLYSSLQLRIFINYSCISVNRPQYLFTMCYYYLPE